MPEGIRILLKRKRQAMEFWPAQLCFACYFEQIFQLFQGLILSKQIFEWNQRSQLRQANLSGCLRLRFNSDNYISCFRHNRTILPMVVAIWKRSEVRWLSCFLTNSSRPSTRGFNSREARSLQQVHNSHCHWYQDPYIHHQGFQVIVIRDIRLANSLPN